jgi:hypothetical protein
MNLIWARTVKGMEAKILIAVTTLSASVGLGLAKMMTRSLLEAFYTLFHLGIYTIFLVMWNGCSERVLLSSHILVDVAGAFTTPFLVRALYRALQHEELP